MKKFLNIDLHISVIADIINVFKQVNENIEIEDWSLSGHTWVLNKKTKNLDILNSGTWKSLDTKMINSFQEKYDTILKTFDGFICCYPVSFILLFEKYNKPIFVVNEDQYCINSKNKTKSVPFKYDQKIAKNIILTEKTFETLKTINNLTIQKEIKKVQKEFIIFKRC